MNQLWWLCILGLGLAACTEGRDLTHAALRDDDGAGADDANAGGEAGAGADDDADPGSDERGMRAPEPGRILTYHRDVKPILDSKCAQCHVDGGIAPFPLTAYDEVEPYAELIRADVEAGVMPPWRAIGPLDIYEGDRRLSDEQKDTVVSWVDQGALEGDPDDAAEPTAPRPRGLPQIDMTLQIEEPYMPAEGNDDYHCFVFEWPHAETKYVTGLSVEPDRSEMVHHAIVYLVQPENAAATRERDAADPGPGYSCFGGTTGGVASWLTSYEPGGYGQAVPGDLGFEVQPGSLIVLQIHYNTLNGRVPDQSRVDFTVEDSVERVGRVVLLMNALWYAGFMPIPANEPDTVYTYQGRPAQLSPQRTYDLYWVDLHMHQLGSRGGIGIVRANAPGQVEPLLQIPDWSFEWQETYILREPVKLHPGDQLVVECHFDNTAQNQGMVGGERLQPRDVNWGDGTTDEMCLGNVLAAEAID